MSHIFTVLSFPPLIRLWESYENRMELQLPSWAWIWYLSVVGIKHSEKLETVSSLALAWSSIVIFFLGGEHESWRHLELPPCRSYQSFLYFSLSSAWWPTFLRYNWNRAAKCRMFETSNHQLNGKTALVKIKCSIPLFKQTTRGKNWRTWKREKLLQVWWAKQKKLQRKYRDGGLGAQANWPFQANNI